jgi:hypothetical protein
MIKKDELIAELEKLRLVLEELDTLLEHELSKKMLDHFTVQRLKKCKLTLKDNIYVLESKIYPDIIA